MIDQIIIGDKASFDDFGASVAKRGGKPPKKKSIKETVPFSNVTHDFTKINGEIYWEERELEYTFEMTAPTPERLEEMKSALAGWLMNVIKEELHDPIIPDYHYLATFEDLTFSDDDRLDKTTATATFSAYPYKIANHVSACEFDVPSKETREVWLCNNSSHPVTPKIETNCAATIRVGDIGFYVQEAGTIEDESVKLAEGTNSGRIVNNSSEECRVVISFREEVF